MHLLFTVLCSARKRVNLTVWAEKRKKINGTNEIKKTANIFHLLDSDFTILIESYVRKFYYNHILICTWNTTRELGEKKIAIFFYFFENFALGAKNFKITTPIICTKRKTVTAVLVWFASRRCRREEIDFSGCFVCFSRVCAYGSLSRSYDVYV